MNYTRIAIVLVTFALLTTGCANESSRDQSGPSALSSKEEVFTAQNSLATIFNAFPFDENGPFDIPSRKEVCTMRKALRKFNVNTPTPRQMRGEIIIEGTVLEARALPNRKQEISVEVNDILFGDDGHLPIQISVISPMERYGGVSVAIGETYRVFVLPLNGKYYSWAATGSAPTDETFSGFYKCTGKQKTIP
jgi:hypothetical protein